MQLSFHGADLGVTGSCHLLECNGKKILIDCGMYQGGHELAEDNAADFGFAPSDIDFLLLTHAHLDHSGRIPLLVKRGFRGEIITTSASRELARLVMLDAAHLQEEEARYQSRKRVRHGSKAMPEPLYSVLDALNSTEQFGRTAQYGQDMELAPGIVATFYDAGHILGSASILLQLSEAGQNRRVFFSGDIGNAGRPLLRAPQTPAEPVDVVIMETTYGDRQHKPLAPSVEELYAAINETFRRGGNVVIPTFALERAQELLYYLREGSEQERIPRSTQVFLDSPMAISATSIFTRHPDCYDSDIARAFHQGHDPFHMPGLHFTRETAESTALNRIGGGAIIMAGAGMCTGGRIRHHLRHNLWRKESSVIFVGFAAAGTLARLIIDGVKHVRIFGEDIPVRARIHTINGFSAHADQAELLAWHKQLGSPARTYLVHGEPDTMRQFALQLHDTDVILPELHQRFAL